MLHQKPKLVLAPLRGLTGHLFRTIHTKHFGGFDYAIGPFIPMVRGTKVKQSHLRDALPEHNRALRLVPQTIGNDADMLCTFARTLQNFGYDQIDWNLGCPFAKITNKKRGAGLLPHPGIIAQHLEEFHQRSTVKLSVKVRLGLENPSDLEQLIPVFNVYPLAGVTIHARTGVQMYTGYPDLEMFHQYAKAITAPVTYNGNILTASDATFVENRFPEIDSLMIGRGVIADPYLALEIRGNPRLDHQAQREKLKEFHDELCEGYGRLLPGPAAHLGAMKELWAYLSQSFSGGERLLKKIQKTQGIKNYLGYVERLFSGDYPIRQLDNGIRRSTSPVHPS